MSLSQVGGRTELFYREDLMTTWSPSEVSADGDQVFITGIVRRCSHQNRMFEDIKSVHLESELCLHCMLLRVDPTLLLSCVLVCAGNHAKDTSLYKAVRVQFGPSIPRAACFRFVKLCPGCIPGARTAPKVAASKPILRAGFGKRGQVCAAVMYCITAHSDVLRQ